MSYLPKPGNEFELVPAGTYLSVCYRLLDLGSQKQIDTFHGNREVERHKIMISWEIDSDQPMKDGRPFTIHKRYAWSVHEKAGLRKDLEGWRGTPFKDSDFGPKGFNIRKVLGTPCMLNIVHATPNDKTYANIASVSALPKAMRPIAAEYILKNEQVYVWLQEGLFDQEAFDSLGDGLKAVIMASPEYVQLTSVPGKPTHNIDGTARVDGMNDEIPF